MEANRNGVSLRRVGWTVLAAILACAISPVEGRAVSRFGVEREPGQEPAEIQFDDIWFYGKDGSKEIPEIALDWLAAAFNLRTVHVPSPAFEGEEVPTDVLVEKGRDIAARYPEIVDVTYDRNLAEDACFFQLRAGMTETDVKGLIRALDKEDSVAYTHPTLRIGGKTVAYFNAFQMTWKTAVGEASRKDLMEQVHAFYDPAEKIYRVDVMATPFFEAVNLLAEDIRVLDATPYLVPVETTIRVRLSVPLQGCQLGDRIPFTLRIDFSDRLRIDPSSLVNIDLRPEGIQKELFDLKFNPYDYVKASSKSPVILTGWMKLYAPGEFVVPAVEIHYQCETCSGRRDRSVETEAIPLQVASIVPAKARRPEIVLPAGHVSPDLPTEALLQESRKLFWQAVACFVLAAVILGGWARNRYSARKAAKGALSERKEDVLAARLRRHLAEAPAGPHWVYAGDAARLLREVLVEKYDLDVNPQLGSGEVFLAGVRARLPDRIASRLSPLLQEIDRMIALEIEEYPELERWRNDTLALLDRTQSMEP